MIYCFTGFYVASAGKEGRAFPVRYFTGRHDGVKNTPVSYTHLKGYTGETSNEKEWKQAIAAARENNTVVLFVGLPASYESESYDRKTLKMPQIYERLIREVATVNPRLVVVLSNGSVVEMPWLRQVKAVLETYLCGEAVGEAVSDVLFGVANPSEMCIRDRC